MMSEPGHELIKLPLMGTLQGEYELFQYLIHDINEETMRIFIPPWLTNPYVLQHSDIINLHLSFKIKNVFYARGVVAAVEKQDSGGKIYTLEYIGQSSSPIPQSEGYYDLEHLQKPYHIKLNNALMLKKLKNILVIKKGVLVYLKHFIPYFSRITGYDRKDYIILKKLLLSDIKNNLCKHLAQIEGLYQYYLEKQQTHSLLDILEPEKILDSIQSEINLDILNLTFGDLAHVPYIESIKELEEQLYWNYNLLMTAYMDSLSPSAYRC